MGFRIINYFYWFFVVFVHFFCVTSFLFLADGSGFFINMLVSGGYIDHEPTRQLAHYLTQFPVILAINLGVTNFQALVLLFGLGHCLHVWISLILVFWMVGKNKAYHLATIPLITLLVCAGFVIGQGFVACSYSIVIAAGIINWKKLDLIKKIAVCLVSILFVNVYEGAFINTYSLLIIAIIQFSISKAEKDNWSRFLQFTLIATLAIYGSFMAFRAILAPLNSAGQQTIVESDLYFALVLTVAVSVWWFFYRLFYDRIIPATLLLLCFLFLFWLVPATIEEAYNSRILILSIPTGILIAEFLAGFFTKMVFTNVNGNSKLLLIVVSLLLIAKTIPVVTHQYEVATYCQSKKGVLQFDEARKLYEPNYELWWTNIYTSIVYQGFFYGEVNSIAGNPTACGFCYDVLNSNTYPDLTAYGITYNKSLKP